MKRIFLEDLLKEHPKYTYQQQYAYIMELMGKGILKPVKSAGTNGKHPALCLSYWVQKTQDKLSPEQEEELKFGLVPMISIEYYLSHPNAYRQDREWVWKLNQYLKEKQTLLERPESVNERSFEIWGREKFLSREQGRRILKRCGLAPEFFHMYETAEPLSYYTAHRKTPQSMLILENKDTFFSMRKFLLEGNDVILGEEFGTLIYGGGKRVIKSFEDFDLSAEPYMKCEKNQVYYFGDLDYEGILIYESLRQQNQEGRVPIPFRAAYEKMLAKAGDGERLPMTKERQNRGQKGIFFSYFPEETAQQMKNILQMGRYIPQEILNTNDF